MDVEKLERVQKKATKLISEISKKPYIERLQILKLPTLKYRQYRGDMIEVFKINCLIEKIRNSMMICPWHW